MAQEAQVPLTTGIEPSTLAAVKTTNNTPIAAAYYPVWSAGSRAPESLDYSKFDILFFAFTTPNANLGLNLDDWTTSILKRVVASAHKSGKGTKIVLSIGGWGGCQYFSQTMSSSPNRGTFIANCKKAVDGYGLDGVDIDWEYPNSAGAGQPFSSADSANLLTFFTYLRKSLGSTKIISAAVAHLPWLGSNGRPLTDVSAYAAQMDYINIMNYDVYGSSSSPGPNAPLSDGCHNSPQPQASADAAVKQWTAAKWPKNKILLGLALYGYVSKSTKTTLVGQTGKTAKVASSALAVAAEGAGQEVAGGDDGNFLEYAHDRTEQRLHAAVTVDDPQIVLNAGLDVSVAVKPRGALATATAAATGSGDLSAQYGQQIAFSDILKLGALSKSGTSYVAANGYTRGWDACSSTPYLYNTSRQTVVTYDDPQSLAAKGAFAKAQGIAGCFTWSLDQDDGYTLQNAIRTSLGK